MAIVYGISFFEILYLYVAFSITCSYILIRLKLCCGRRGIIESLQLFLYPCLPAGLAKRTPELSRMPSISVMALEVTVVLKRRGGVMPQAFLVQTLSRGELADTTDWCTGLLGSCILKKTKKM